MTKALALALLLLFPLPAASAALSGLSAFAGLEVRRVELSGNRFTRAFVILRELRTRQGQPLDLALLQADLQRLDNLDLFSSVRVRARSEGSGVVLTLELREIPPVVPYITYDVSDQDGWSFGPAIKAVNLLGLDLFAAGFALFGGRTSYLLDLNYPWIAGNHLSLDLDLSRIERDNELDAFRESVFEFSPWIGTYLGERGRLAVGLSYFRVRSDRVGPLLSTRVDDLVQVGARLGYDSRDVWADPHRGWEAEIEVRRTGGPLPGDGDFWTGHLDLRRYQPAPRRHTLVLAGLLSLQSGAPGEDLPVYMDFHLGGANSVRGYTLEELGPILFGRNQLIGTLEYRLPLAPRREYVLVGMAADLGLSAALFADWGLAWNDRADLSLGRSRAGLGAGLRLLAPAVDMTRFDVGYAPDGGWNLHFAVFSKMDAQRFRLR